MIETSKSNVNSDFKGDERVKDAQEWLNDTYTGKAGYTPIGSGETQS